MRACKAACLSKLKFSTKVCPDAKKAKAKPKPRKVRKVSSPTLMDSNLSNLEEATEQGEAMPDLWNEIDSFVEVKEEEVNELESITEDSDLISVTLEADLSDPIINSSDEETTRCLICFCEDPNPLPLKGLLPKSKRLTNPEQLEADLRTIYLLKMIFQWTTTELSYLMKSSKGQSPRQWIHVCQSCRLLIFEIQTLENRMRDCRKKIRDKIMETEEMSNVVPLNTGTMTTRRIRGLVNQQVRSAKENIVFIDGDRQAEELLKIKMSTSTSEPIDEESYDFVDGYHETGQLKSLSVENDFLDLPGDLDEGGNNQCKSKGGKNANRNRKGNLPRAKMETQVKSMEETKYACLTCPHLKGMNLDAFIIHLVFHWRRPIRCTSCKSHLSSVPEVIEEHCRNHHPDLDSQTEEIKFEPVQFSTGEVFRCENCPEKFVSFQERNEHEKSCHKWHPSRTTVCSICKEGFMNSDELRLHRAMDHPEVASVGCYFCEELFPVESSEGVQYVNCEALKQHCLEKEDHPKGDGSIFHLFACDICGLVVKDNTRNVNRLKVHYALIHPEHQFRSSCFICHKEVFFSNKWTHLENQHAQNAICDMCGEEMRPTALPLHKLAKHDLLMEGYRKYECAEDGCGYKTVKSYAFNQHISVHHNRERERSHKCEICGKTFFTQALLKRHMEIHQNKEKARLIQCEICGGTFTDERGLNIHNRSYHLGFKCASTPPPMNQKCDQCAFVTNKSSELKRHTATRHSDNGKPLRLVCFFGCSSYFGNMNKFDEHLISAHSMELEKEEHIFHSEEEFEHWKNALKERESHPYAAQRADRSGAKTRVLICSSSSLRARKPQGKNLRKRKSNISDKVCRSRIVVKCDDAKTTWKVTFHKTHTGHDIEQRKVGLSDSLKRKIVEDLKNGTTKKQVLDRLREGGGEYGDIAGSHLINRQDIDNICRKYKLSAPFDVRLTSPKRKRKKYE